MTITYEGFRSRNGTMGENEVLEFMFHTDNQTGNVSTSDNIFDVLNHPQCPRINRTHPLIQWMVCSKISYRESPDGKWVVPCEYRVLKPEEEKPTEQQPPSPGQPPDPLPGEEDQTAIEGFDFDAHLSIDFDDFPVPATGAHDATTVNSDAGNTGSPIKPGIPIVASNLERYDPPPSMYTGSPIVTIRRNVPRSEKLTFVKMRNFHGALNIGKLYIPEWELKIPEYSSRFLMRIGEDSRARFRGAMISYRPTTIQLKIDWATWRANLLDLGTYEFTTTGTKTIEQRINTGDWSFPGSGGTTPFKDDDENGIRKLLDGSGNEFTGTTPFYNEFWLYREKVQYDFLNAHTNAQIQRG